MRIPVPPERLATSTEVLDAFIARSWRSNAQRQRDKGIEFVIGRRQGVHLWNLEATRRIVDCGTAGGVHSLGHRHPQVLAALRHALDAGCDSGLWSMPNPEYLRLQDTLVRLAPTPHLTQSVVTLSSTTSVDVATMFAFRFTGRQKILAYRHGYHGHSGFAALATGSLEEGILDHYNLPRRHSDFFESYGDLAEAERRLTPEIAAFVIEPMDYETFVPAPREFIEGVSSLCRERGILFILDETRTGLGRTGEVWASQHYDVDPDILIVGKGLSGGLYPVSALLLKQEIYDRCMNEHPFAYISSLGGNEISCIVANKVLEVASEPAFLDNVRAMSQRLKAGLDAVCTRHHNLMSPGSSFGCILTVKINDKALAPKLYRSMFDHGVLCHSVSEIEPSVLKFFPPLVLAAHDVDEIVAVLDRAAHDLTD